MVTFQAWQDEFQIITTKYFAAINWDTVIWHPGEIEQAGDDLQLDAYRKLYDGEDSNPSICEWEHYEESCDARGNFQRQLSERWEKALEERESESR